MQNPTFSRITLVLSPVEPTFIPFSHGQYLNGLIYGLLPEIHPKAHEQPIKSFSLTELYLPRTGHDPRRHGGWIHPHQETQFTIAFHSQDLSELFSQRLINRLQELLPPFEIGSKKETKTFQLLNTRVQHTNLENLEKETIPLKKIRVRFQSPTIYAKRLPQGTRWLYFWSPELQHLLRSVRTTLNKIVPISEDENIADWAEEFIGTRTGNVKTVAVNYKTATRVLTFIGMKGTIEYLLLGSAEKREKTHLFLKIAEWLGVGAWTTIGMGNIKLEIPLKKV